MTKRMLRAMGLRVEERQPYEGPALAPQSTGSAVITSRTTSSTYDAQGRFVIVSTNALSARAREATGVIGSRARRTAG